MCDAWKRLSKYHHDHVELVTTSEDILCGFVHAVDPETGNVILLSEGSDGEGAIAQLVTASAIEKINSVTTHPSLRIQLPPPRGVWVYEASAAIASVAPQVLVDELRGRRIDARIVNDEPAIEETAPCAYIDIFSGVARIVPPFCPHSVRSANHNVLGRIRAIVQNIHDQMSAAPRET